MMKKLTPVRLLKNKFYDEVKKAELTGADVEELSSLLGRGRAKKGMFEGDIDEGELEIGQIAAMVKGIQTAREIVEEIWNEFLKEGKKLGSNFQ
jgi:enoyl-[acyl-carrier protein] reductase II